MSRLDDKRGVGSWVGLLLMVFVISACANRPVETDARAGMDRTSPVRAAEINTQLGIGYMERGQRQLALEKLEQAVGQDPEHVPAHLALAHLYGQLGDEGRAGRHFRRAAQLAPNDGATLNSYAVYLCRRGDFRRAEQKFLRAADDPFYQTPEVALTNAGACARRAGSIEDAEQFLRRAIRIDPEFPDALLHLAHISYQQGDAFRARAFLQRFEAAAMPEPGALLLGYRIESNMNNPDEARRYVMELERVFPDSSEARELRQSMSQHD